MLDQNAAPPHARARLLRATCCCDVTHDPAMLALAQRDREHQAARRTRTTRREMMELFTLGADRGATPRATCASRRARSPAGARRWRDGVGPYDFRFDAAAPRRRARRRCSARRGDFDWQDACRLCLDAPAPPVVLRRRSCGATSSRRAPDAATQARARSGSTSRRLRDPRRSSRRSCGTPRSTTGPRMVKPPVVYTAGLLRALGRGSTRRLDVARRSSRASASSTRRTSPAGTTRAGSTPRPGAAAGSSRRYALARRVDRRRRPQPGRRRARCVDARVRALGQPALTDETHARCSRFAQAAPAAEALETVRGCAENALRLLVATSPDFQTADEPHCLPRLLAHRAAARRAARGRRGPAGDRARHAGARRHRAVAPLASSPRWRGLRARRLRRRRWLGLGRSRRASRARPRRRAARSSSRSSWTAASTRCRVLSPAGDPRYSRLRPTLALASGRVAVRRGRPAALASVGGGARDAARRGQGQRAPGGRLRPPGPVALHVAPLLGGRRDRRRTCAPAGSGRYLDRVGTPDNPLQGLSLDDTLAPALATRADAGRGDRRARPLRVLGAGASGGRARDPDARRRRAARAPRTRGAAIAALRAGGRGGGAGATGSAASCGRSAQRHHEPGGLSGSRRRLPAPARRARGDARRRPAAALRRASTRPATTTRTPTRRTRSQRRAEADRRTRCSRSSATSRRAGSPTACSSHVWSEFGRRAAGERLAGTDHGAAGVGFLIGTRVRGQHDRRVPGPRSARRRRQPARDRGLPRRLRVAPRAVVRRTTPRASSRTRRPSRGRSCSDDRCLVGVASRSRRRRACQVAAKEFNFGLSRRHDQGRPRADRARELRRGRARPPPAARRRDAVWGTRVVPSEETATLAAKLPPGRYKLWCSLANHRALGMEASLTVKK